MDPLDRFEQCINGFFKRLAYEAKKDIDDIIGSRTSAPYIIAVRSRNYDERQACAHSLGRYASRIRALQHASYVIAFTEELPRMDGVIDGWRARPVTLPDIYRALRHVSTRSSVAYHLHQIGADSAQRIAKGEGVKVAIIDTGADDTHEELRGKVVDAYDFVQMRPGCSDPNGHGTHVSGLVAGTSVGVAPAAQLYVARVLDAHGSGNEAQVGLGIDWAITQRVNVINMSLGSKAQSPLERDLIAAAISKGILVCAAAGNEGAGKSYPAAYDGVLSVAAVDRHNEHASFSNVDESVDISAPGVEVLSCVPGGYAALSGTSMASPIVAGSAALAASAGCSSLEAALLDASQPLGRHDAYGAGLVRVDRMVGASARPERINIQVMGMHYYVTR